MLAKRVAAAAAFIGPMIGPAGAQSKSSAAVCGASDQSLAPPSSALISAPESYPRHIAFVSNEVATAAVRGIMRNIRCAGCSSVSSVSWEIECVRRLQVAKWEGLV